MSLLIVGSVVFDSVETPFRSVDNALGGSATYISLAASYFTAPVYIVGVVGSDFPKRYLDLLEAHNVNLTGLQIVEDGLTFRGQGSIIMILTLVIHSSRN